MQKRDSNVAKAENQKRAFFAFDGESKRCVKKITRTAKKISLPLDFPAIRTSCPRDDELLAAEKRIVPANINKQQTKKPGNLVRARLEKRTANPLKPTASKGIKSSVDKGPARGTKGSKIPLHTKTDTIVTVETFGSR